jgi:type IV secretion system protein VirD4
MTLSDKYDITMHPNYKYLSDENPKNTFDITKHLDCTYKPKLKDICTVYEYTE